MRVEELMSRSAHTCCSEDTLNVPASLMWDRDVGAVVVLNDADAVAGMITDRDICIAAYTKGRPLSEIRVADVATRSPITCLPTDSLAHVEKLMSEHQIRRLPVVDWSGKLVGIISQNDLIREAAHEHGSRSPEVAKDDVLSTLDAVGKRAPRPLLAMTG